MRNILFCGNVYGAGNIGDDAILEGLVTEFKKLKGDILLGAISMSPEHTKSTIDIDCVWSNRLSDEKKAIEWATHIILGGGTLITDRPIIRYPLKHCCRIIDHAINAGKPISMIAAGVSDIKSNKAKKILNNCIIPYLDLLTVRSEFDKQQAICAGGINKETINVGADGAFSLKTSATWQPANIIGISLVSEGNDHIGYPERVAKAINTFQFDFPQFSYEGVCSEIRKESQFDYQLIKKTLDYVNGEWKIQDDYKSPQDFIKYLSKFNFVFTMRMHILVFCSLVGIPCIAMIRLQKTESMLNSLGINEYLNMNSSESEILEKFKMAVTQPEKFLPDSSKLKNLKNLANKNAILWFEANQNRATYKTSEVAWYRKCLAKYNSSLIKNITRSYLGQIKLFVRNIVNR